MAYFRCIAEYNVFVDIKISMFTREKRKKTGMLYIFKLVCLLQKYGKTGMLYILKLVCLLLKYKKTVCCTKHSSARYRRNSERLPPKTRLKQVC